LIGEKYMDVLPTVVTDLILKKEAMLKGYSSKGLVDFVDVGTQSLEETKKIFESFRVMFTDPKVQNSMTNSLMRLDTITLRIEELLLNVNKLTASEDISSLIKSFEQTAKTLQYTTEKLFDEDGEANFTNSIGKINESLENITVITDDISRISGAMASLVEEDGTTANIKGLLVNTNKTLESINNAMSKNSIKNTVQSTNKALWQANDVLESIRMVQVTPRANINKLSTNDTYFYDAGFSIGLANKYETLLGFSNRSGNSSVENFQVGIKVMPAITGRIGLIRNLSGIGADYRIFDNFTISTDFVFNNATVDSDVKIKLNMYDQLYILLGKDSLMSQDSPIRIGIGF
jgi:hypothetical protein